MKKIARLLVVALSASKRHERWTQCERAPDSTRGFVNFPHDNYWT
jgi:hypothetical protein